MESALGETDTDMSRLGIEDLEVAWQAAKKRVG